MSESRWRPAGGIVAVLSLAALGFAPVSNRPATGSYDATEVQAADPFIDDEWFDDFTSPDQLEAVPVGAGQVAKPVQLVLAGAPVIKTLGESGIPAVAVRAYKQAEARLAVSDPGCGVPWTLLAAIGRVESNHGRFGGAQLRDDGSATRRIRGIPLDGRPNVALIRDTDGGALDGDTAYDRAVGPMQFIPSTWRSIQADANGDGFADPNNIFDAAQGAAQYLCAAASNLRDPSQAAQAVRRYNNADSYVRVVLSLARMYQTGGVVGLPSTGNQLPNESAVGLWRTSPPAVRPWPNNPLAQQPWSNDSSGDQSWQSEPTPAPRTSAPAARPRTTVPAGTNPVTTAKQPRPTSKPTAPTPKPTQTRPPEPTQPSVPAPTTNPKPAPTQPSEPNPSVPALPRPSTAKPSEPEATQPSEPKPSKPSATQPSEPKPSEPEATQPSEPKPSESSQAPESGKSTPAPSANRAPKPTTVAVGWAPAMRQVVGQILARQACSHPAKPQPDRHRKTCPDDTRKPSAPPQHKNQDQHTNRPQQNNPVQDNRQQGETPATPRPSAGSGR